MAWMLDFPFPVLYNMSNACNKDSISYLCRYPTTKPVEPGAATMGRSPAHLRSLSPPTPDRGCGTRLLFNPAPA